MKKIRALIADDEPLAREGIAVLLEDDREVEVVGQAADGEAALAEIRRHRPDLVFLDVQMPRLNGLEALATLPAGERPAVIFVTAYDKYAVQAFEAAAVDYVLKPFRDVRFRAALQRAKEQIRRADSGEASRGVEELLDRIRKIGLGADQADRGRSGPGPARMRFRVQGGTLFVDPAKIVWIEAQRDSVRLCVGRTTHLVREPLSSIENRLDPRRFTRAHRSFVVNVERVEKLAAALYGDLTLEMDDGEKIPLSRNYRERVRSLLRQQLR